MRVASNMHTHKRTNPQKSVQRYNKKCTYARKQTFFLKKDRFIYRQCYFTAHREFTHGWAVECIARGANRIFKKFPIGRVRSTTKKCICANFGQKILFFLRKSLIEYLNHHSGDSSKLHVDVLHAIAE